MSRGFTSDWLMSLEMRRALKDKTDKPAAAAIEIEGDLHSQIIDECMARRWQYLHGSMAQRTHRTEGEPDFVILADRSRVFFIECKSRVGKLSPEQQAFKFAAEVNGHTVHIVRSLAEFLEVVK